MKITKLIQFVFYFALVTYLGSSCSSNHKIDRYFKNEIEVFQKDCLANTEKYFHVKKEDVPMICQVAGEYLIKFSNYSQRSMDSLKEIGVRDFLIFQRINTLDRTTCSFVYNQKTEQIGSLQCSIYHENTLQRLIRDWKNLTHDNQKPRGNVIDYVIFEKNKKISIIKM